MSKEDISPEQERYKTYRFLYVKVKKLIKQLLLQADDGQQIKTREVYAVEKLITQLREIMADQRQLDDAGDNVRQLITNVIEPYTSAVGQKMLDKFYVDQKAVLEYAQPKAASKIVEVLKQNISETGTFLQAQHDKALENVERLFKENI
jgi:hypothetical protein